MLGTKRNLQTFESRSKVLEPLGYRDVIHWTRIQASSHRVFKMRHVTQVLSMYMVHDTRSSHRNTCTIRKVYAFWDISLARNRWP